MATDRIAIAHLGPGTKRPHELQDAVRQAWQDILSDPASRSHAARILEGTPIDLESTAEPPFDIEATKAGMTGGEIVVMAAIWVGKELLLKPATSLLSAYAKKQLQELWTEVVSPAVRRRLGDHRSMGTERIDDAG